MKIKPVRLVTKSIFRRSSQRDDYLVGLDGGGGGGGCVGQMERKQALFFKYSIRAMLMIEMSLVQSEIEILMKMNWWDGENEWISIETL